MRKLVYVLFTVLLITCVAACAGKSSSSSDGSGSGGGGSDVFCFSPETAAANPGDTVSFTILNGTPPYQFGYVDAADIQSYSDPSQIQATFDSNTGVGSYTVGPNSDCTDKIAAQDSTGALCYMTITVGSGGGGGGGGGSGDFTNAVTVPCHWGSSCPTPVLDQATFNGKTTSSAMVDTGAGNTSIVSPAFKSAAGIGSSTSFSVTDPNTSATYSLSSVPVTSSSRGHDVLTGRHFYGNKLLSIDYDNRLVTFADGYSAPAGANSVTASIPGSLGYFLIQGTVSGNAGVFVVDTGGDITIFCSELRAKINNISGSPGGTRYADQMVLNGVTYTNIKHYDSSATPADQLKSYYDIDGLIGATFLARFHRATFDYKNSKLILEE
jgi:plastocyanin